MVGRWWEGRAEERFWLESTDREDLGADLRAPSADETGNDNWRYTLFREAKVGDQVFHYDKRAGAITAVSRVDGPPFSAAIVWAARGSYARERGAKPAETPGYRIPLSDFTLLEEPVTLEALRAARSLIEPIYEGIAATGARYFPFELSDRPLRPLQGYAFKLPAAFVSAFPALVGAVGSTLPAPVLREAEVFHGLVADIEAAATSYAISGLQRRRSELRGLKRVARSIFGARHRADDWTFHLGGRDELHFNLGLDELGDIRAFRAGVAFSLEPSRSLPDVSVLEPKVARFNAWMRENPETFADLAMWHYHKDQRSEDYLPGPIPQSLVTPYTFIFLGGRQPLSAVDPHQALQTLDRFMPLWEWVESGAEPAPNVAAIDGGTGGIIGGNLRMDLGREIDGGGWIQATTRERTLNIFLRHKEMQRRLKDLLLAEGWSEVILEPPIGLRAIDAVARNPNALWFYEVKTAPSDRGCIREALGQLLEYALWPGATQPDRLVVVGEPPLSSEGFEYLARLNLTFPIPVDYRQLTLALPSPGASVRRW